MNDEKNNIKFSIIMPVYNVSDFLEEAILSVLNQKYQNIQLIIINDGSTDGSQIIAEKFAKQDNRIIIINKENEGLSVARNVGVDVATGDYIFFMDSDDIIREDLFMIIYQRLHENMENVFMIGYEQFNEKTTYIGKTIDTNYYTNSQIMHAILSGKLENFACQFVINKTVLSKNDLKFKAGVLFEDIDWTARFLSKIDSIYYINKPLYKYRVRLTSITHTKSLKKVNDLLVVLSLLEETLNKSFPNELQNFSKWRRALDLTIYFDFSFLGWESKKLKSDMYSRIMSYDYTGLALKQMIKLALIKFRIVDFLSKNRV